MELPLHWISNASVLAILIILPIFLLPQTYELLKRFFLRLFFSVAAPPSIITIAVYEFDANNNNELFLSVHAYLISKCFPSAPIVKFSKPKNSNALTFTIDSDQVMEDTFDGMRVKWLLRTTEKKYKIFGYTYRCRKIRSFELSFHNRHATKVHSRYLPHVMQEAARINRMNMNRRERNQTCGWVAGWVNVIGTLVIQLTGSC